jgi:nucleoside 2-deoxyribosyltransferase
MFEIHAYLAGPDVFFPHAQEIGRQKIAYLRTLGIVGHFPLDNEVPGDLLKIPAQASRFIGDANEKIMLD